MKHYDSFENVKYDLSMIGEEIWASNKLDGQNFCAKYSPKLKEFSMFGSKTQNVDESSEQFGEAVRYFKEHMAVSYMSHCKLVQFPLGMQYLYSC